MTERQRQKRVERRWCQRSAETEKKTQEAVRTLYEDRVTSGVHIDIL